MWYTVKKADLRIFTFMHWFKHTILQFKIIYFCLYRCREYCKYISTTGLILHCLAASMVMPWLEQGAHTFSTWPYGMQDWTIRSLYRYIYQYIYILYFIELSPFFPCLFLQHLVQGRNASLGTQLCQVRDRKGSRAGVSALPSCLVRNEETQHFAAQALKVHSLLVVILEKRFGAAALPQTEGSTLLVCLVVSGSAFCVETGHLQFCHLGIWLFCEWR